jgi:formylglycine-generating enzyme required for sulfatase activity
VAGTVRSTEPVPEVEEEKVSGRAQANNDAPQHVDPKIPTDPAQPESKLVVETTTTKPDVTTTTKPDDAAVRPSPVEVELPRELTLPSIDLKLVLIPAGSFLMGSSEGEGKPNEHPQHKVTISQPFYMGQTEVTQA